MITRAQVALSHAHLPKYADDIVLSVPKDAPGFARLATWAENLRACFDRWTDRPDVSSLISTGEALAVRVTLDTLSIECRIVLDRLDASSSLLGGRTP